MTAPVQVDIFQDNDWKVAPVIGSYTDNEGDECITYLEPVSNKVLTAKLKSLPYKDDKEAEAVRKGEPLLTKKTALGQRTTPKKDAN